MKFKMIIVPSIVVGLVVSSYASCNKDEILSLVDTGFSKQEIKDICKSEAPKIVEKTQNKEDNKWLSPSKELCLSKGGAMRDKGCETSWIKANKICKAMDSRLATIEELDKVMLDCGAVMKTDSFKERQGNSENSDYVTCHEKQGFSSAPYWSSSDSKKGKEYVWNAYFGSGSHADFYRNGQEFVRCIK